MNYFRKAITDDDGAKLGMPGVNAEQNSMEVSRPLRFALNTSEALHFIKDALAKYYGSTQQFIAEADADGDGNLARLEKQSTKARNGLSPTIRRLKWGVQAIDKHQYPS
ncbi:hypothetical protein PR202_ga18035 [Eleusine coracana subsp. coracana]|uniref:Uncharacterized protein n=1 Tax=Eleusine coracana subsp. coracana TaxID=191504 RepID=A0AAV5CQX9_ELECO|nr:hypothetical protein PR202_ga18035 [Eleusine coracana subsp. coracana]